MRTGADYGPQRRGAAFAPAPRTAQRCTPTDSAMAPPPLGRCGQRARATTTTATSVRGEIKDLRSGDNALCCAMHCEHSGSERSGDQLRRGQRARGKTPDAGRGGASEEPQRGRVLGGVWGRRYSGSVQCSAARWVCERVPRCVCAAGDVHGITAAAVGWVYSREGVGEGDSDVWLWAWWWWMSRSCAWVDRLQQPVPGDDGRDRSECARCEDVVRLMRHPQFRRGLEPAASGGVWAVRDLQRRM